MAAMRYPVRVGFLAGLTVAQISEFSLILAALGLSLGHITTATVSLITVVGLLTIGGSTYLILYSHQIYARLNGWLRVFEWTGSRKSEVTEADSDVHAILYGLGRFGRHVADHLSRGGHRVLAVDFDPHRVGGNSRDGVTAVYGSAEDVHFLETLPLAQARFVISTIPLLETNKALLHALRHHEYRGHIALTAHTVHDAEQLRGAGAEVILEPFSLAAEATTEVLDHLIEEDFRGDDRSGTSDRCAPGQPEHVRTPGVPSVQLADGARGVAELPRVRVAHADRNPPQSMTVRA